MNARQESIRTSKRTVSLRVGSRNAPPVTVRTSASPTATMWSSAGASAHQSRATFAPSTIGSGTMWPAGRVLPVENDSASLQMPVKPSHQPPGDIPLMLLLCDAMPFVGIDDELGLHAGGLEGVPELE